MTALGDLRPGDETDAYQVTGHPQRHADGQVRVPVLDFAHPWREAFVTGEADDEVDVREHHEPRWPAGAP